MSAKWKKDAAFLRKAARGIEIGKSRRSCWALQKAQSFPSLLDRNTELTERYVDVMLGGEARSAVLFAEYDKDGGNTPEAMDVRVLLLCFAAALAETGDL